MRNVTPKCESEAHWWHCIYYY